MLQSQSYYLINGADPTIVADDGMTALDLARHRNHQDCVLLLEVRGLDT